MARIELEVETVAANHGQEEPEPDHEPYSPTAGFDQKLPETEKIGTKMLFNVTGSAFGAR